MKKRIGWHRLFGITMDDLFQGSDYAVELEKDLSVQQQLLDVLIIRKDERKSVGMPNPLPDGLDVLRSYNLMTYKSHRQTMNAWTLDELIGHYVSYRKLASPSPHNLLPAEDFQLFAVSAKYPEKLLANAVVEPVGQGVMDVRWGSRSIRMIILRQIPKTPENAPWHLFSARMDEVIYGAEHYRWRSNETSGIINDLFEHYNIEGFAMPYTREDYIRDHLRYHIDKLSPEERLKGLPPEERLKGLSKEVLMEVLKKRAAEMEANEIDTLIKELLDSKSKMDN